MKIFKKLFLSHLAIGLISVFLLSLIFYTLMREALIQRTVDQLSSANMLKKNQVESYLIRTKKNLTFLFSRSEFQNMESRMFEQNDADALMSEQFKSELAEIEKLYEFRNISLIDKNGGLIFSLNADTSYIRAINEILRSKSMLVNDSFRIVDVTGHDADKETVIIYLNRVYSKEKYLAGFILVKENFERIQAFMTERTGLGSTGESYLVGADYRMRSSSRFYSEKVPYSIPVHTEASEKGLKNLKGKSVILDYRGIDVLSMYRPVQLYGLNWALITEIDVEEAMKPVINLRNYVFGISALIILLVISVTVIISNNISRPILRLKNLILILSKGIVPEDPVEIERGNDEIADMSNAMNQLLEGMKRTAEFARETGSGNFDVSYALLSDQDSLGLALLQMRDELKGLQQREIRLVQEKANALIEGQENERKRIGRELHDGVGQLMTVVKLRLEELNDNPELKEELKGLINEIIGEIRRISYNVMPAALVDFGLEAALKGLVENTRKYSNINFDFEYIKETEQRLNFEYSIAIYRIVQEALNNILKHAEATEVYLHVEKRHDEIYLYIKDNGKGFDFTEITGNEGFGLRSMKERVALLSGRMELKSAKGKGTGIEVFVPVSDKSFIK